jgi:hypothetical protein
MDRSLAKPSQNGQRPRRRVTTLAEVVAALQDTCADDRQVVRALRQLMKQGTLRRLVAAIPRAA